MRFGITEGFISLSVLLIVLFILAEYFPKWDFYIARCFLIIFPNSVLFRMTIAKKAISWGKHTKILKEKAKAKKEALALLKRAREISNEMPGAPKYRNMFIDEIDAIEERAQRLGTI